MAGTLRIQGILVGAAQRLGYAAGVCPARSIPSGNALAIEVVRAVNVGDKKLYIMAGRRLDVESTKSLSALAGIEVFLYRRPGGGAAQAELEKISSSTSTVDSATLFGKLNELA